MDGPIVLVFSCPLEDRDDEYNEWYTDQHLEHVLNLDGFKAAQRFLVADNGNGASAPSPYLALYEVEDDQMNLAMESLARAKRDGKLPMGAIDTDSIRSFWFLPISERHTKAK